MKTLTDSACARALAEDIVSFISQSSDIDSYVQTVSLVEDKLKNPHETLDVLKHVVATQMSIRPQLQINMPTGVAARMCSELNISLQEFRREAQAARNYFEESQFLGRSWEGLTIRRLFDEPASIAEITNENDFDVVVCFDKNAATRLSPRVFLAHTSALISAKDSELLDALMYPDLAHVVKLDGRCAMTKEDAALLENNVHIHQNSLISFRDTPDDFARELTYVHPPRA